MTALQLPIEGMPEPIKMHHGYLYVGLGENALVKIGRSATTTGKSRRFKEHRNYEPTLHEVCAKLIPYVAREETSLRRILADYVETRIDGRLEWFYLDAYTGQLIIQFMAHRGADTIIMEREFARVLRNRINHEYPQNTGSEAT